jgi:hypothetical protein
MACSLVRSKWELRARGRARLLIAYFGLLCLCTVRSDVLPQALARAQQAYSQAHSNYLAAPGETKAATAFARACFELADIATDKHQKATVAQEGIDAARLASENDPNNGEAFLFLGLNQGALAETKSLGALSLLRQMEKALLRATELDAHLDHAAADRSLGLLYRDAPGRPVSLGSKTKAREHLERAVSLDPDYPDNVLSLLEGYEKWDQSGLLQAGLERYRRQLPEAKKKYSGPQYEQPWRDWAERQNALQQKLSKD